MFFFICRFSFSLLLFCVCFISLVTLPFSLLLCFSFFTLYCSSACCICVLFSCIFIIVYYSLPYLSLIIFVQVFAFALFVASSGFYFFLQTVYAVFKKLEIAVSMHGYIAGYI